MADPSIVRFRNAVAAGYANLEAHRGEINDLNVFPVADGDTGDNMAHTLRAVMAALDRLNGQLVDDIGRTEIVHAVAEAALLGARGNSGVILSQVVRGAAEELASRPGELVDPVLVAAAFARAADAAYDSVREPAEGTMLTVVREMAHRVATDLAHSQETRLAPEASPAEQDALLAEALGGAVEAGRASVERGPQLLPVLREAGVVDAGGVGLTVLLEGVVAELRGQAPPVDVPAAPAPAAPVVQREGAAAGHASSTFRYCTNFVVSGARLTAADLVSALEEQGDSVLVVGDPHMLRVHVHTDEPEAAVTLCQGAGAVSRLDVADMREQIAERDQRLRGGTAAGAPGQAATCGVVVVATGDGLHQHFRALGAHVLEGGPTLNPSTVELLAAIHSAGAEEVVVLPNSSNVIMAAERAAELSEKKVHVVQASHTQQGGLSALVGFDPMAGAERNAAALTAALERVRTGALAPAARDDARGRFRSGDAVGFVDEHLVAWGTPEEAAAAVLGRLAEEAELLTCLEGQVAEPPAEALRAAAAGDAELELLPGGQPSYWWLITAE